jgi:hypothetical protein
MSSMATSSTAIAAPMPTTEHGIARKHETHHLVRAPVTVEPGVKETTQDEGGRPGRGDEHESEQRAHLPGRVVVDPVEHPARSLCVVAAAASHGISATSTAAHPERSRRSRSPAPGCPRRGQCTAITLRRRAPSSRPKRDRAPVTPASDRLGQVARSGQAAACARPTRKLRRGCGARACARPKVQLSLSLSGVEDVSSPGRRAPCP